MDILHDPMIMAALVTALVSILVNVVSAMLQRRAAKERAEIDILSLEQAQLRDVVLDKRHCKLCAEKVRNLHQGHAFSFGTHEADLGVNLIPPVPALMEELLGLGIKRFDPIGVGEEGKVICLSKNGLRVVGGNVLTGCHRSS